MPCTVSVRGISRSSRKSLCFQLGELEKDFGARTEWSKKHFALRVQLTTFIRIHGVPFFYDSVLKMYFFFIWGKNNHSTHSILICLKTNEKLTINNIFMCRLLCLDSRMLSVFSCTMSVFSRLSARTKAPCSTVSSSMVAARSCSPVLSSFHAAWACGCSRLLTVSTIAWGGGGGKSFIKSTEAELAAGV